MQLSSLHDAMGDTVTARRYYALAEGKVRRALAEAEAGGSTTTLVSARLNLAEIENGLGRTEEALRLTAGTQALVDGLDDEYTAALWTLSNAGLYGSARRADLAVPLLARVLEAPNGGLAYGPVLLNIDPGWDRIRDDPRFVALLQKYPAASVANAGDRQRGTSIPTR